MNYLIQQFKTTVSPNIANIVINISQDAQTVASAYFVEILKQSSSEEISLLQDHLDLNVKLPLFKKAIETVKNKHVYWLDNFEKNPDFKHIKVIDVLLDNLKNALALNKDESSSLLFCPYPEGPCENIQVAVDKLNNAYLAYQRTPIEKLIEQPVFDYSDAGEIFEVKASILKMELN